MTQQNNKFLGEAPVGKLLRMFAIPCVLSLVIQALYNIVDQIFIGNAGYLPFGNTATEIAFGVNAFRIYMGLILVTCLIKSLSIFFQAIGKPVSATVLGLLRDVIFIVPLTVLLPLINNDAFMWSAPIADVLTAIVAAVLLVVALPKTPLSAKKTK